MIQNINKQKILWDYDLEIMILVIKELCPYVPAQNIDKNSIS